MVQLGDIICVLPKNVQEKLLAAVTAPPSTDDAFVPEMKKLLRPYEAELATVGVIPDYLAYVLLAVRTGAIQAPTTDPSLT